MSYHFGLIGYPIKHSLSPVIHQQFFNETNLVGKYSMIEIDPRNDFEAAIIQLKAMNLDGFNVTVPHKQNIIPFLDEIDQSAKNIGAVNTVLNKDNRWIGYNTDAEGYVQSLESDYPHVRDDKSCKILILGAGGAAKGIYHGLLQNNYNEVYMANRTINKAEEIVGKDYALTLKQAEEQLAHFDVVIQTTSVGMKPNIEDRIISLTDLKDDAVVSDIVYQPMMTKFLREANERGAHIHLGHTMLIHQAKYSFQIWTGETPAIEAIEEILQDKLKG